MDKKIIIELNPEQIEHLNLSSNNDVEIVKYGKHLLIKNKNHDADIYDLFSSYEEELGEQ